MAEQQLPRFVARWDLDKTYLRTEFDTPRDLIKTALERPDQKRSVPGAASVLRELGRSGAYIHILSGSPRQMRGRLEEKLRIDRVRWDELTLKPNLSNALRLRFRAIRDQLGYKLPVLLKSKVTERRGVEAAAEGVTPLSGREVLVGDDAEADAFVYSLFADLCDGQIDSVQLKRILAAGRVYSDVQTDCLQALGAIRRSPMQRRILIHLERQTPPSRFNAYGARVVPFYNYLQAAFVLGEDGLLGPDAVLRVASEFALRQRFDAHALARSYHDLMRRGHVAGDLVGHLEQSLAGLIASGPVPAKESLTQMVQTLAGYVERPPERIERPSDARELDYVELARRHRRRHRSPFFER
ncbi:MAG: hypothetical protein H6718_24340 [Polyangiaceae bacterium]|nr:hypothetical protein [Myxococcales bacterium]MCB9588561.1 hypothetical protein [Polyangiaceae bacterium]